VVAAIMVAGPLEVVDEEVWSYMRAEGIWGANEKLEASEEAYPLCEAPFPVGKERTCQWLASTPPQSTPSAWISNPSS